MKTCCFMAVSLALVGSAARVLGDLPPLLTQPSAQPSIDFVASPPQSRLPGGAPRAAVTAPALVPAPPSLEERQLSYGLLEQKLARQFPNSKVYLISMAPPVAGRDRSKGKVVVRGQCPTNDEATSILKILQEAIVEVEGFRWQTLVQHEGVDDNHGHAFDHVMGPIPVEQAAACIINELKLGPALSVNGVEVLPRESVPRSLPSHLPLFSSFISPLFPPLQSNPSIGDFHMAMPVACPLARNSGPIPQGPPSLADADPFQSHLRLSEEHLRQAGLTDAANQLHSMHRTFLIQHQATLLIARKETQLKLLQAEIARLKQTANSSAAQISLRIRLVEVVNDAPARESIRALFIKPPQTTSTVGRPTDIGSIGGVFESAEIQSLLDHLCKTGDAKVVFEPQMTVLNGQQARFLSGGEFAVPNVIGVGGSRAVSYRPFGTSIEACPTVAGDRISLNVHAKFTRQEDAVKQANHHAASARRIQTTVEMRPGQTLVLGGIKVPQSRPNKASETLGTVTEVGSLVDDLAKSNTEDAELLVFITPEIVPAMEPHEVPPVPGFEMTRPASLPPAPAPAPWGE